MLYKLCKTQESLKIVFKIFSKNFHEYIRMEDPTYTRNYLKSHLNCFHKFFKKHS